MTAITIYILISILFGTVSCLFGKKLYFPILMITVFSTVVAMLLSIFDLTLKAGVITIMIGIIAALLSRFLYKLGVFFLGGILGGGLGVLLASVLPPSVAQFGWIIVLAFIIVAAICAVKWLDFFIIASTSFNGAFAIVVPIWFLFTEFRTLHNFIYADGMLSTMTNLNQYLCNQFLEENGIFLFLLTFIIALGGFSFQNSYKRKE